MMAPVAGDTLDASVEARYRQALFGGAAGLRSRIDRSAFYDRARTAYAVVMSGETAKYGNIILKKGVSAALRRLIRTPLETKECLLLIGRSCPGRVLR